jgi:TIGR03009 family protein
MRRYLTGLSVVLLVPVLTLAQQSPPTSIEDQWLDYVLKNWEAAMTRLDSFSAGCVRTTTDKTFGGAEVYEGSAKFLKSPPGQPSRALLFMEKKGDPSKFEKFLYTGTYLYEYVPATKVIRIHNVPQPKAGQPAFDDNIVALLFGMKADDAKKRYQMTWVQDKEHNNKYYHYVRILPRTPQDKADFTEAQLVLTAKDFLPCRVWYHQPNGNEVRWDFKVDVKARVLATTFEPPHSPDKGWRWERVPPPGSVQPAAGGPPKK